MNIRLSKCNGEFVSSKQNGSSSYDLSGVNNCTLKEWELRWSLKVKVFSVKMRYLQLPVSHWEHPAARDRGGICASNSGGCIRRSNTAFCICSPCPGDRAQVNTDMFRHPSKKDISGMDCWWLRSLHPAGAGEPGAVTAAEGTSEKTADRYFISAFPWNTSC